MGLFGKYSCASFVGLISVGLVPAAQAQDCPPLTRFASVKLENLPNSKRVLVPVTINGVAKKFLLDTAGMSAFITKESADELNLPHSSGVRNIRPIKTFGIGGRSYELPANETNDTTLVSPEYPVSPDRDGNIDGTLTTAYLLNKGELDIDFPNGTLSLFSPDHCPGKINYWGAPDLGYLPLSHATIDLATTDRPPNTIRPADIALKNDIAHLTVPVMLDGHALNAWIDTSAEKSSISAEVAERLFNLTANDLGPQSMVKATPSAAMGIYNPHYLGNGLYSATPHTEDISGLVFRAPAYRHKFSELTLGNVAIKNMDLLVLPDVWGRNNDATRMFLYVPKDAGKNVWQNLDMAAIDNDRDYEIKEKTLVDFSNAKRDVPDMVLGMDVLRHLHVYLSLKENRMYFSAGAPSPAPSSTPSPAPATK